MSCEKKNQVRYRSHQKGTQNNTPIEQAMRFRVLMDDNDERKCIFITVYRLRIKVGRPVLLWWIPNPIGFAVLKYTRGSQHPINSDRK